jgi:hypothetical protein
MTMMMMTKRQSGLILKRLLSDLVSFASNLTGRAD